MQNHSIRRVLIIAVPLLLVVAAIVYLYSVTRQENGALKASGTVETVEISVAPELSGRVAEVLVSEGDAVQTGVPLYRLEDDQLKAQRNKAAAAQETAQANVAVAQAAQKVTQANLDAAQAQYQMAFNAARAKDQSARTGAWRVDLPAEIDLPVWYFEKSEEITAAQASIDAAQKDLKQEQDNLEKVLQDAGGAELKDAEKRLADAQEAFQLAKEVKDRADNQTDSEIRDFAQNQYDSALDELNAAQSNYDQLLSAQDTDNIREARARLAVAQERYDSAQDRWYALLTGADALEVQAANITVQQAQAAADQADANITQAEKALAQAQAELALIDVQLSKLEVTAPASGVILTRNIEPGEVIQAGAPVMTLGRLDQLTITVYIPEDRYGEVSLQQSAQVTVDYFPGETFDAVVTRIADRSEYTPRNVQTEEGRRSTVYAVELSVRNPQGKLKPGMPADVEFVQP